MRKLIVLVLAALGLLLVVPAAALASPKTFYVHPSGGNDTANIQAAFNAAVKAGPGSTVQLSAGHFYTNTILVRNFNGYFKGAGEGQTVIDTAGTLPVTPAVEPWPFLIGFQGGSVSVCGISVDITAASPGESWLWWWQGNPTTAVGADFLVTGSASAAFDQVSFTDGAGDDAAGYNVANDIEITGTWQVDSTGAPSALAPTGGYDSVSRCTFTGDTGIWVDGLTAGRMTIGGCDAQQNVFNEVDDGCLLTDNSNSDITVSHNRMAASQGESITLWQSWTNPMTPPPPLPAPRYLISDNHMVAANPTGGECDAGGMWLEDDSLGNATPPSRLNAVISGNSISLANGGIDAGIDGYMVQNIKVLSNRISGTGLTGVNVGTDFLTSFFDQPASGWQIIGNDFSGLNPTNPYTSDPAAQVWLGPNADHCLVVGGCKPTTVLNQGTDDTLINVTPVSDPPAAAAAVGVPAKLRALKEMKRL